MALTDIVGYTFAADIFCPRHIIAALPTGDGGAYDGWALAPGVRMTAEDNLSEIAYAFQIDRQDEATFDSDEFPKVIFSDQAITQATEDASEDESVTVDRCSVCHEALVD